MIWDFLLLSMAHATFERIPQMIKPLFRRFFNFYTFEYRVHLAPNCFPYFSRCNHYPCSPEDFQEICAPAWLHGRMLRIYAIRVQDRSPPCIAGLLFKEDGDG